MPIRFQVDPDFYDHPKTLGMSDAATALWVRAGSYSAAKLTDGFVADAALALLSQTPMEAARELTRRGLWSRVKGGYVFHEWGTRNLTRARVEADKTSDRERKRRERESARRNAKSQVKGQSVRSDSEPDSDRTPEGIPLLSVSVSGSVSGSGQAAPSARAGPEPPRRCPTHIDTPDPPPCGACADARHHHDRWQQQQTAAAAQQRQRQAADRAATAAAAIAACGLCDESGYRDGQVCHHDPRAPDRARNGAARVRAAIRQETP